MSLVWVKIVLIFLEIASYFLFFCSYLTFCYQSHNIIMIHFKTFLNQYVSRKAVTQIWWKLQCYSIIVDLVLIMQYSLVNIPHFYSISWCMTTSVQSPVSINILQIHNSRFNFSMKIFHIPTNSQNSPLC